ncbi:helix-turn-helix transcriptional regulator [Kitasatospora sp. GP82]|uniref:helix-turn-helix domain-containing protein n=1 Tax=Kitasatospora sp. GP82 TaxID=3035089 RepID=UPI0024736B52|nr:helix-turn-helix transcriptional regulator [Kitasatospora sp. GP82]MDH6128745.1 transcriptional regulator with XRE-family HTH domain [Kitasatospora sp. GP82]
MAWRYCGNQIKLWRERSGVTREELGKAANYEYETIRSMEQGRRKPTLRLLEVADELCNAHGLLVAATDYLKPERFPSYSQDFANIESEAIALHSYAALLIPGLLQTEEYARTLISNSCPPLDDETVAERVAGRLQRQDKLRARRTALFGFVIYEAALRSMVGGAEAMKRQLHHLLETGELRNVAIQVLPTGCNAYPGLSGSLVLLETAAHEQFAYVEGQETGVLYSDPAKVSALTQRHGMIRMQALGAEDSARFIRKVAEEL